MDTSKQYDYHWSIKYTCYSKLINSEQYAHVCYDFMELHWFQARCENSFAYVIVNNEKYDVYHMNHIVTDQ